MADGGWYASPLSADVEVFFQDSPVPFGHLLRALFCPVAFVPPHLTLLLQLFRLTVTVAREKRSDRLVATLTVLWLHRALSTRNIMTALTLPWTFVRLSFSSP